MREAILLMLGLCMLAGCGADGRQTYAGYVEAEPLRLAPGRSGYLDRLSVERGDEVDAGAALFAVDAASEEAALAAAEARQAAAQARSEDLRKGSRDEELAVRRAQLDQARAASELSAAQLQRQQALYARDAVSREVLDQAQSAVARDRARVRELQAALASAELAARDDALRAAGDEARAAAAVVREAQAQLAQKQVQAPAGGTIEEIYFRPGEWVAAGQPVLALLPPQNRHLRFFVPETALGGLQLGQAIRAHCDGCAEPVDARIRFIAASAEYTPPVLYSREQRARLVYRVEAQAQAQDAARLRPGQPVDVEILP
ncbi:HlyD family secretion protein [Sinimarinibacterium flocculans]|uniref:HlyD family secretion protein n=1 Tax=Sinimarinibacterium flocculans TaxID=985250 RepID=UPI0035146857